MIRSSSDPALAGLCTCCLGNEQGTLMLRSGLIRILEDAANEAVGGACDYCYLACLAFRTLAQRCRCASAIRSRASLLRIRLPLLTPFALPRAANAFPTLSVSFWSREYSLCREATTLFRFVI